MARTKYFKCTSASSLALSGPGSRHLLILGRVVPERVSDLGNQRVIGVGVIQKRRDAEKHFADCQCWAPLVFQNVQADTA
jgi:hypothetical protein